MASSSRYTASSSRYTASSSHHTASSSHYMETSQTATSNSSTSRTVTYAQLDDDEFEYSMRNRERGRVYMINNYSFNKKLPERIHSGLDRDALLAALLFVGFKQDSIVISENLTTAEMEELAATAADRDYKRMGCLLFIVLTHGDEENIYGVDCEAISYEHLLAPIRKASTGKLEGIPKMLLVQACKSSHCHPPHGYILNNPTGSVPVSGLAADDAALAHDADITGEKEPFSTAKQSDLIIAYSTVPATEGGSRFIQAFCEVMKRDGRRLDVTTMVARASRLMSYTPGTSMPSKSLPSPCIISQLKKSLYFS